MPNGTQPHPLHYSPVFVFVQDLEARCAEQELRKALHKEKEAAMREDKLTVVPFLKVPRIAPP